LDNIVVRDYIQGKVDRADRLGSLTPVDITAITAAKVKLAAKAAIQVETREVEKEQPDSEDEDEYEEVQTLGRMSTRSHKQVKKFFTAAEAIEGIVEVVEGVEQGVEEIEEDIEGSTIVDGDGSEPCFDTSDEEDAEFNDTIDGDIDQDDENI
jgi:Asp-tRNA(Asn)/Glu-tRNA(Gln) amidotransferase C subunit